MLKTHEMGSKVSVCIQSFYIGKTTCVIVALILGYCSALLLMLGKDA